MQNLSKTRKHLISISIAAVITLALFSGCSEEPKPQTKELLVYCGITMVQPIIEIAKIIEAQEKCRIEILKGGSGHLIQTIIDSQVGDMFLPGADFFMDQAQQKGVIKETILVGYNQAVLMVQKGNPLQITPDLENLADPRYAVVFANPESCSIGRKSQLVLENLNLYQKVLNNAIYLTTDSKDLVKAIKEKKADLVFNWRAPAFLPENREFIEALELNEKLATQHPLILGRLKFSQHPEIVKKFMQLAKSPAGQTIFRHYGFLD